MVKQHAVDQKQLRAEVARIQKLVALYLHAVTEHIRECVAVTDRIKSPKDAAQELALNIYQAAFDEYEESRRGHLDVDDLDIDGLDMDGIDAAARSIQ
jgi:hypothetical protein